MPVKLPCGNACPPAGKRLDCVGVPSLVIKAQPLVEPHSALKRFRLAIHRFASYVTGEQYKVNPRGKSLYDFWGSRIAETLAEDLEGHADRTVVNLASNEYFKAVNAKTLDRRVIEIKFLEEKDGKARPIQYYTKFGRGVFARWIVQNRINAADDLRDFRENGYRLSEERSEGDLLVFERPQPPKKS